MANASYSNPRETVLSEAIRNLDPELVHEQLERIVSSRHFARSERLRKFLCFAVERVLAGTANEMKEYLVGTAVFERGADFDPRVDPIVRVEARRLRKRLKAYYDSEGSRDAIDIDFPTGSYVPVLSRRQTAVPPVASPASCIGLAVLPFTNLTAEGDDDYFSDGLAEELLHLLAGVQGLRVVAWHSASQLRGRDHDYLTIHQQLKVERVLRGSVRRFGDRVRVTAQLVDAEAGSYLWSEVFDRDIADVFSIQVEIAHAIVEALRLKLSLRSQNPRAPINSESHRLCLLGRFYINKRTPEGILKGAGCFEQAAALDPGYAVAHAHMADAYTLLGDYAVVRPREIVHKAEAAALRALSLDPDSAEAHASLGLIRSIHDWKWSESAALFRRAIELNPSYAAARHWYACDLLAVRGQMEEGLEQVRFAIHLDPLSLIIRESLGFFRMLSRDYEGALLAHRELMDLAPDSYRGHSAIARVLGLMGRHQEAIKAFRHARRLGPDVPAMIGGMGQVLAEAGNDKEARQCLDELTRMEQIRYVPSTAFAVVHLGLGEVDRALDRLERGCNQREFSVTNLKVHPIYDRLRGEPRAIRLIEKMGL